MQMQACSRAKKIGSMAASAGRIVPMQLVVLVNFGADLAAGSGIAAYGAPGAGGNLNLDGVNFDFFFVRLGWSWSRLS
jgi:hypothetical protein